MILRPTATYLYWHKLPYPDILRTFYKTISHMMLFKCRKKVGCIFRIFIGKQIRKIKKLYNHRVFPFLYGLATICYLSIRQKLQLLY